MTWIRTVGEEEAEGLVKEVYDAWRQAAGFVPNVVKSTSLKPLFTKRFEELRHAITFGGSRLGRRREEMIAVALSALNRCTY